MRISPRFVAQCACIAALPFATIFTLSGCGGGNDDEDISPLPSPSVAISPIASPPAQTVSGTLNFEDVQGFIATAPFTPTTAEASGAIDFYREFTFKSREAVTAANGNPVTRRSLTLSLPVNMTPGTMVTFGSASTVTFYNASYDETQADYLSTYRTRIGENGGSVTLVSVENNIYTFDVAVILEPGTTKQFTLRGRVSVYATPVIAN